MEGDELMLEGLTIFRKFPSLTFYHRFYQSLDNKYQMLLYIGDYGNTNSNISSSLGWGIYLLRDLCGQPQSPFSHKIFRYSEISSHVIKLLDEYGVEIRFVLNSLQISFLLHFLFYFFTFKIIPYRSLGIKFRF